MRTKRKNASEASEPVVVVGETMSAASRDQMQRGMMAGVGLRLQVRH